MKKNKGIIIVTISLVCVLSACGSKTINEQNALEIFPEKTSESLPVLIKGNEALTQENNSEIQEEQSNENIVAYADKNVVRYEVLDEYYENGAVKIHYPKIDGMENIQLQNQINENIKKYILKLNFENEEYVSYELNYEIATKGTGLLSMIFQGYENIKAAAHPNSVVKTLNIDMTTGDNLRLKDYSDFEYIVSSLETDSGYTLISDTVTKEEFSLFLNNGYMTDYAILLLDYDIDFFNESMYPTGYSYIKDNKVHMFISVEHAIGDYVDISFDKQL